MIQENLKTEIYYLRTQSKGGDYMTQITPYLSFEGNCKEAMEFYNSCFGGKLDIQLVKDAPKEAQMPGKENWVMHSMLTSNSIILMAADLMMGGIITKGNNITLTINGGGLTELKGFFEKLSEGGKVRQPLQATFFGTYGDLVDKFGITWAFQSDEK